MHKCCLCVVSFDETLDCRYIFARFLQNYYTCQVHYTQKHLICKYNKFHKYKRNTFSVWTFRNASVGYGVAFAGLSIFRSANMSEGKINWKQAPRIILKPNARESICSLDIVLGCYWLARLFLITDVFFNRKNTTRNGAPKIIGVTRLI